METASDPRPAPLPANRSSRGDRILVILFGLLLWIPLIEMVIPIAPAGGRTEKRQMAAVPRFEPKRPTAFLRQIEPYFNDHFGWRDLLVTLNNRIQLRLFHTLPIPKLVVGRNGWIFYRSEAVPDGITILDYKGLTPYRAGDLDRIVRFLRDRADQCRRLGAECLVVVVPNKETVYSEYLPPAIHRISPQSRLDQVAEAVRSDPSIPFLDLRPALIRGKQECPHFLYNPGGTHWNTLGAYFGYRAIIIALAKMHSDLRPLGLSDFVIQECPPTAADHWLGLAEDPRFQLTLRNDPESRAPMSWPLRVVAVHDSFWDDLEPFLIRHFKTILSPPKGLSRGEVAAFIEREKPDLSSTRWSSGMPTPGGSTRPESIPGGTGHDPRQRFPVTRPQRFQDRGQHRPAVAVDRFLHHPSQLGIGRLNHRPVFAVQVGFQVRQRRHRRPSHAPHFAPETGHDRIGEG
jgi:hypothetical protein